MVTTRTDPIRGFKFEVLIIPHNPDDSPVPADDLNKFNPRLKSIGFAAMSGLAVTNEVIQYREGGMNTHPHKMVGQTDFAPISFQRGVFEESDELWKWQKFIHNWQSGAPGSTGGGGYRCNILVYVYDHPHTQATYSDSAAASNYANIGTRKLGIKIFNAWPASYTMSGLNAVGSEIMVQELSLVHEGFLLAWTPEEITALATLA